MKNTEYRIGNIISDNNASDSFFAEIKKLDYSRCYYGQFHSAYSDLKPVPITAEWLDMFAQHGQVVHNDNGLIAEYWYRKLQIKYSKTTKKCIAGIVFENHPVFLRTLEYVHELQNLFFALTGEELELKKEVADGGLN
jgi:hypothetical protein